MQKQFEPIWNRTEALAKTEYITESWQEKGFLAFYLEEENLFRIEIYVRGKITRPLKIYTFKFKRQHQRQQKSFATNHQVHKKWKVETCPRQFTYIEALGKLVGFQVRRKNNTLKLSRMG